MNCLKVTSSSSKNVPQSHEPVNRARSWSSSHMDSVGESNNSKQSAESHDTWRRIRLQQILFKSVVQNDLDMVLRCLKHGADLGEEYTPHFQTALHESARRGFLRMTELLLRAGANPNVLDEKSFLPLHYACQEGHMNTVKCLLLYGSMVTIENEYGDAPIHTATRYGHAGILPLLLSVDLRRDFDRRRVPERYEKQEHLDLQNANGDSCLHIAAALDRKVIVKKFLQWGANHNTVNLQGLSPLQVAIEKKRMGIIKLLQNPPGVVFDRPFYTNPGLEHQAQQAQHPFRSFEGLQRYSDEIARHKMEHEGMPRSYLEPIFPKAMSTESLSQQSKSLSVKSPYVHRVSSPEGSDPPSSRSRAQRNVAAVGHKVWPSPTKVVELDPQPNNINTTYADQKMSYLQTSRDANSQKITHPIGNGDVAPKITTNGHNIEHQADSFSKEMTKGMNSLNEKYTILEKKEEQLRRSVKKQKKKDSESSKVLRREKSELHVTYNDNNSNSSNHKNEESDRKVSQTYYVPPAPKIPVNGNLHTNTTISTGGLQDEHVIIIREMEKPKSVSIDEPDGQVDKENDIFFNTRITEYRNGRRYIREAPKIKDYYSSRVGRISPKIRDLQDQLRRSQYKNIHYDLYDEDF